MRIDIKAEVLEHIIAEFIARETPVLRGKRIDFYYPLELDLDEPIIMVEISNAE